MQTLIPLFVFIFGLITGSFLNAIIYRLSIKESFLSGKSYCPHCKHTLAWQDLIPLLSFLLLKGKCRYCSKGISIQYPLVELATGILFVLVCIQDKKYLFYGATFSGLFNTLFLFIISSLLIIIFVYDFKHYIIPDRIIYPAIVVSGIWYLASGILFNTYTKYDILDSIYSAFGAAAFFLMIVLVSRGKWMGVGDIKLAFLMGLLLSFPNILVALFLAFFTGAMVGITLILAGKKTLKSEVPFGPFLVAATFLTMFFGREIIDLYFRLY